MNGLRAIVVSVDFADLLRVTLAYNRHHFSDVMVVTTPEDQASQDAAKACGADVYTTDSFYEKGAVFNKHKPLEEGLSAMGRYGWICLLDADVLWPKNVPDTTLEAGHIYGCRRRIAEEVPEIIPSNWSDCPIYLPKNKWLGGFTQIFHSQDRHLPTPPWHETNWRHAGGADTMFQQRWPKSHRHFLPFEVLHLGEVGLNWCGRVSPYLDGSVPEEAAERRETLKRFTRSPGIPKRGPHERY
jgi:hypothetical protein